ncbi:histidine phosphatase family protein [Gracilibacillus xinjiangensis]|uniref:Histidine phosphatase family protein n=1 Tax=Gracilibacillus xinjiangensis TaxID=1193282 RepID=A0ABV8WWW5_9BACI
MNRLILIRHSIPVIEAGVPSNEWVLAEEGIDKARIIAKKLSGYCFGKLYTSMEPKAIETAKIIADHTNSSYEKIADVHEHLRTSNRKVFTGDEWLAIMQQLFTKQDRFIFGDETAGAAKSRFDEAIKKLIKTHTSNEDILLVTHGTVMSLFLSLYNHLDGFEIWCSLGMPAYVELTVSDYQIQNIVTL